MSIRARAPSPTVSEPSRRRGQIDLHLVRVERLGSRPQPARQIEERRHDGRSGLRRHPTLTLIAA